MKYVPKPFDPVIVTWEDAHVEALEQHDTPELAILAHAAAIRKSIGFWVGQGATFIAFATDDDRCPESTRAVGGITYIPLGMVRSIDPAVTPPPARKRKR